MIGFVVAPMSTLFPSDLEPAETPAPEEPVPELSEAELKIARERFALDRDLLALDRERLEAERESLEHTRTLYGTTSNALHVSVTLFAVTVLAGIFLGGLLGFNSGVDVGRDQAPPPRKILIGKSFLELLRKTALPMDAPAPDEGVAEDALVPEPPARWFTIGSRPVSCRAAGNMLLVR